MYIITHFCRRQVGDLKYVKMRLLVCTQFLKIYVFFFEKMIFDEGSRENKELDIGLHERNKSRKRK